MREIMLFWRDPAGSLIQDTFDDRDFKIRADGPFLQVISEKTGIERMIPISKVELVRWVFTPEPPPPPQPPPPPPAETPKEPT